jgi:hypothetical protein
MHEKMNEIMMNPKNIQRQHSARPLQFYDFAKIIIIMLVFTGLFYGCTNSFLGGLRLQPSASPSASPTVTSVDNEVIASAVIATPSGTPNAGATTTLYFNTSSSSAPILNHCNALATGSSQTSKPCNCKFSWSEVSSSTGTNSITGLPNPGTSVPHQVLTAVTQVQPSEITCPAPSIYNSEIAIGTQINITVLPANNNPDSGIFTVSTLSYIKPSANSSGSFADSQGNLFDNILRYSCYSLFQRGTTIQSAVSTLSAPGTGMQKQAVLATQFCLSTAAGSNTGSNCTNLPSATYSSENYYYDMYIQTSELGHINSANSNYICPRVTESLSSSTSSGATSPNSFYPLDSTFALSIAGSSTFNVGVVANSIIQVSGDQASTSSGCPVITSTGATATPTAQTPATATSTTSSSIVQSCLGYATSPNTDGTCPYFTNAFGQIQLTYRLRKYIALYPRIFDTNGKPLAQAQGLNTVYVIDRPVNGPSTVNPLKPYTMKGPKPCPSAFFDTTATAATNPNNSGTTTYPWYVATNNSSWAGKNIDGIQFPNVDSSSSLSCSAAIPYINSAGQFTIETINVHNGVSGTTGALSTAPAHMYIRPTQPFLAHYEEDTTFKACAPLSNAFQDPPLHFVRDSYSGNVAWCAESYPTQNNNVQWIDPPVGSTTIASGKISNYTSHTVKNTASSTCTATIPTIPTITGVYSYPSFTGLPGVGIPSYATHSSSLTSLSWDSTSTANASETCDRTVVATNSSTTTPSTQWSRFPLLAPPNDIENSTFGIETDSSYYCLVSYDNNGGKTNLYSPTDGCCSKNMVYVQTGITSSTASTAHLEPTTPCNSPTY